ncbi:hypothetical protein CCY99_09260 [Helicobacter sp. 16-1353]|nr:hypothetical protein CCY99_09260 [Helicobacter sp. 16-1353]
MNSCKIHFLNVDNGDCTIIEHETGRISVIDICSGNNDKLQATLEANFNNQANPTDPIEYLKGLVKSKSIFRFILHILIWTIWTALKGYSRHLVL